MFTLTDLTADKSWDYETEAKLKTVARLYAFEHPSASLAVTINGQTHKIR